MDDRYSSVDIPKIHRPFSWSQRTAQLWKKFTPPSRPSMGELRWYKKMIGDSLCKPFEKQEILILGSTTEFRKMFFDLGAHVTVCDRSKEYYLEISTESALKENPKIQMSESRVHCFWHEMTFQNEFDVIIGDLAVGNVHPDHLEVFIQKVINALKPGGIFCGKSLFLIDRITAQELHKRCQAYNALPKDKNRDPYAYLMYPLSIYAREDTHEGEIDFRKVKDKLDQLHQEHKISSEVYKNLIDKEYDQELNDDVAFFAYDYTYFNSIITKEKILRKHEEFSADDIYGDDIPVWAYKKESIDLMLAKKTAGIIKRKIQGHLDKMLTRGEHEDSFWALSNQYYILNLVNSCNISNRKITDRIKTEIQKHFTFEIDSAFNVLCNYDDDIIKKENEKLFDEEQLLSNGITLEKKDALLAQKSIMAANYSNALAFFVLSVVGKNAESLKEILKSTLFQENNLEDTMEWISKEFYWLTARVLLCLKGSNEQLGDNKAVIKHALDYLLAVFHAGTSGWGNIARPWVKDEEVYAICLDALLAFYDDELVDSQLKSGICNAVDEIYDAYMVDLYEKLEGIYCWKWGEGGNTIESIIPQIFWVTTLMKILKFKGLCDSKKDDNVKNFLDYYDILSALLDFVNKLPEDPRMDSRGLKVDSVGQECYEVQTLQLILSALDFEAYE